MATHKDKILVVVDPTAADQPAAARGAALSAALDCDLELLICHYDARIAGRRWFDKSVSESMREQALRHQLGYLEALHKQLAHDDVAITTRVVWDTPRAEGIIRATLRDEPSFVLKDTHHHSAISRTLFSSTDWQLIRDCPAPLWLVKGTPLENPLVLAAVDPMHEHDKPAALDDAVLAQGEALTVALHGKMHVYHGYDTLSDIAGAGAFAMSPTPIAVKEINARVKSEHEAAFAALLARRGLEACTQHLIAGAPGDVLPGLARQLGAGLAIMGAVARNRVERAVVGSTAERVLDYLPCDVLVVKPPDFDSGVIYKAQSPGFMELTGDGD
jgi:universal stress protein E